MNALILCNGEPPSPELFHSCRKWADYFIAADGGGNVARSLGAVPDVVIGDLDSFKPKEEDSFEIIYDPDQYKNDLEKALIRAAEEGASSVEVLGGTGKRVDQTLKNLSVLKQFNAQFKKLVFKDDFGDSFLIPSPFSVELKMGTLLSLFPLSGKVTGITTQGLKYPLKNGELENGIQDGSSNEVVFSPVKITYKEGDLLVFVGR